MSVHLGEAEIGNGRGLEALQDFFPADLTVTKALEQGTGFVDRHGKKMSPNPRTVTREMVGQLSPGTLVVMMPEQPVAILEKIPDHDHIDHQNDKDHQGKIMGQFVKLDGNEKS